MDGGSWQVQETGIKTMPKKKKCRKAKWLSEEALQIAVKRRDMKSKGEKERYNHMDFIFQFVNVVNYIDWFVDFEESLHPWDKAHLVMVYDLFNVLLDSDC